MRLAAWAARMLGLVAIGALVAHQRSLSAQIERERATNDVERDKYGVQVLRHARSGRYDLVYLGAFGGMTQPYHGAAMNGLGDVCASYSHEVVGDEVPIRVFAGKTPEQIEVAGKRLSGTSRAINAKGHVVGEVTDEGGTRGFLWTRSGYAGLPPLAGYLRSVGTCLTSRDLVAGYSYTPNEKEYWRWKAVACVWRKGEAVALPLPPGCVASRASGINEKGFVVGDAVTADDRTRAFCYDGRRSFLLPNLPGGDVSSAAAINDLGQIAGSCQRPLPAGSEDPFVVRPVMWQGGKIRDLGLPKGFRYGKGNAINSRSEVCVTAQLRHWDMKDTDFYKAFVWSPRRGLVDLNGSVDKGLGYHCSKTYGISDGGALLVQGRLLDRPWEQLQPFYVLVPRDARR